MEFTYYHNGRNKLYTSVNGVVSYDKSLDKKLMLVKMLMSKQHDIEISFREEYTYIRSSPNNNSTSGTSNGYSGYISQKIDFDICELHYKPVFIFVDKPNRVDIQKLKRLLNYLLVETHNPFIYSSSGLFNTEQEFTIPVGLVKIEKKTYSNIELERIQQNMLKKEKSWYEKVFSYLK